LTELGVQVLEPPGVDGKRSHVCHSHAEVGVWREGIGRDGGGEAGQSGAGGEKERVTCGGGAVNDTLEDSDGWGIGQGSRRKAIEEKFIFQVVRVLRVWLLCVGVLGEKRLGAERRGFTGWSREVCGNESAFRNAGRTGFRGALFRC
jgi:hypothetical protein